MAEENKYIATRMDEGAALNYLNYHKDTDKPLDVRTISNLQLAYDHNPSAFSKEHKEKLVQWNREIISKVATGKYKLDSRETEVFKNVLKHAPAMVRAHVDHNRPLMGPVSDTKEQRHYKQAEQILYNVENGIKKVSLKSKGVAVSRLGHIKFIKARNNVNGMFTSAKGALEAWQQRRAEAKLKREEERLKREEERLKRIEARKKEAERKREEARKRRAERLNKLKTDLGNIWKGTKKVATDIVLGIGYAVTTPFVWGFEGAKAVYNGAKWVRDKYKDKAQERKAIRDRAISINKVRTAKNKKEAEKSAMKSNLDELTPAQIAANWSFLGSKQSVLDKETDGRYRMTGHSRKIVNSIVNGELKITEENAPAIAEWLKINMDVQDKVNQDFINRTETEKNAKVAELLKDIKERGLNVKGKTKETEAKQAEAQTPEIATPEQAKQEDPLKSIDPAQMQKIEKEMSLLREFKKSNPELGDAFTKTFEKELATKGKEGFGLNEAQINAIKANNTDLFPKEENKKAQPVNSSEELGKTIFEAEQSQQPERGSGKRNINTLRGIGVSPKSKVDITKVKNFTLDREAFEANNSKINQAVFNKAMKNRQPENN